MLQQTQVATVIEYYRRFLRNFPNVSRLAVAAEQDVLKLWAGLGYYRRARQLHAAAQVVVADHNGVFPTEFDDVLALPGIGRYTAGAITSFAYDSRSPILEANTIRLYSRLIGLSGDPTTSESQKKLWTFAESLLPVRRGSGKLNQALMELGSLVCKPIQPDCERCPISGDCTAFHLGKQNQIPVKKPKVATKPKTHALVIVRHNNKYLLRKNPIGQWWQGLWDFPRIDVTQQLAIAPNGNSIAKDPSWIDSLFECQLGLSIQAQNLETVLKHAVTRYRITLNCFRARLSTNPKSIDRLDGEWEWVDITQEALPLTATADKLQKRLARTDVQ